MHPGEKQIQNAASRLVIALQGKDWIEIPGEAAQLEVKIRKAIEANFDEERQIDAEARRLLDDLGQKAAGMDHHTLFLKIRQQLAKERGFVL